MCPFFNVLLEGHVRQVRMYVKQAQILLKFRQFKALCSQQDHQQEMEACIPFCIYYQLYFIFHRSINFAPPYIPFIIS